MDMSKELPPYVTFEKRPVEDRDATIAAGCPQYKDVDFAIIIPLGSKDKVERVATEWLAEKAEQATIGRFPAEWLRAFQEKFKSWQEGEILPETGTPIKSWSYLNPAQVQNLLSWKVYTVETLAKANQELIGRIGMGGVSLVQAAQDFVAQANDSGKVVAELSKLRAENGTLLSRLSAMEKKFETLKAKAPTEET
jgi:hypothetical protein